MAHPDSEESQRRPGATVSLLAFASVLTFGCGGASTADDERTRQSAARDQIFLSEREPAGDVESWSALGPIFTRPELDLLAAGVDTDGRALRLRVITEAPARSILLTFTASTADSCVDDQITIDVRIDAYRRATIRASDVPARRPHRIDDASLTLDGNDLVLDLPLTNHAELTSWYVFSANTGKSSARSDYGDSLPDWYIHSAGFTRGTGTPTAPSCGPADPPLLPR